MDKTITAIISITILEGIALLNHIDGLILSTVLMLVAGLGGYSLHAKLNNSKPA